MNDFTPTGFQIQADSLPQQMLRETRWVAWRYEERDGKPTKVPINPRTGRKADVTDPAQRGTFEEAVATAAKDDSSGVGFVLGDGYAGGDLDNFIDPATGEIDERAVKIIKAMGTYAERSPSGTGVHFIGYAKKPGYRCARTLPEGRKVELYDSERFLTVTGDHIADTPKVLTRMQTPFEKLYRNLFPEETSDTGHGGGPGPGNSLTDEQVLERAESARNGERFRRLMAGDTSAHAGDDSSADLALCNILRFWTGGDPEQMDRIFRRSALMRPKWDERHAADGRTYGDMTIGRSLAGRGPDDFYRSERNTEDEGKKGKGSAADRLVAYALDTGGELFVDQFGAPHVFAEGCPLLLSSRCHRWLIRLMWDREGKAVSGDALRTATGTLAAFAEGSGIVRELHTRAAFRDGALYYEREPGRVVKVDGSGWSLVDSPPVLFRRLANLKSLPHPECGGSIEDLCRFVNLKSERDKRLFCAYAVTLGLPHVARPILLATGPMGSGKSTTSRVVKRLWDPTEPEAIRTDPRDFLQKASHCFVVMLDNQSRLSEDMSDTLCRLVTGEADSKRKLYSDDEDIIYSLRRAILLNGINVPTERGDLLDRSLAIELERLSDGERRTEEELWTSFDEVHPKLLGEAFRLLSKAIAARPRLALDRSPRLADWGYYATGVYEAMGWGAARFLEDWGEVVEVQEQATLEGSPVAQAILLLMDQWSDGYSGTATQLHTKLTAEVAIENGVDVTWDKAWPRSSRWLWKRIKEVMPLLASRGVSVEKTKCKAATIIKLNKAEAA